MNTDMNTAHEEGNVSDHMVELWLKQNEIQSLRSTLLDQLKTAGWSDKMIDRYNEYLKNVSVKNRRALRNQSSIVGGDQRAKTYEGEQLFRDLIEESEDMEIREFVNLEEAQIRTLEIVNSKTWKEQIFHGSEAAIGNIHVELKKTRGRPKSDMSMSYQSGLIRLSYEGLDEAVLLHELAHIAGNYRHDVAFRNTLVKLTSTFMGVRYAKLLKRCYKDVGLKMREHALIEPKPPSEWVEYFNRMKKARKARGYNGDNGEDESPPVAVAKKARRKKAAAKASQTKASRTKKKVSKKKTRAKAKSKSQ